MPTPVGVMRAASALLVVVALVAAGCVDGSSLEAPAPPAEDAAEAAEFDSMTGALDGLVTDTALFPVGGARVVLAGQGALEAVELEQETGPDGRFVFSRVEPGTYRVQAVHAFFHNSSQIVQVVAGQAIKVSLTMNDRPSAEPFVELGIHGGVVRCDSAALIFFFVVLGGACVITQGAGGVHLTVDDSWRYGVWEIDWDRDGEWLGWEISSALFTCDQEPCYGVGLGPAPGRLEAAPGMKMQDDEYLWRILEYPDGPFEADIYAYYGGIMGDTTTTVFGPTGACPYRCYGAGITPELRFNFYLSVFHYQAPSQPEAYTAIPDK